MSATIYLEGGGDSKYLNARCREGFRKLFERCGFSRGRLPKLVACGGRDQTYSDFVTAHHANNRDYVAMLVDSEEPVADVEAPWDHLQARDRWTVPAGAADFQVLLMTTCMETWIVADRSALTRHYGQHLQVNALPALVNLEHRARHDVQDALTHATRNCGNAYAKGERSFELLGLLTPAALEARLPSFVRVVRILNEQL